MNVEILVNVELMLPRRVPLFVPTLVVLGLELGLPLNLTLTLILVRTDVGSVTYSTSRTLVL